MTNTQTTPSPKTLGQIIDRSFDRHTLLEFLNDIIKGYGVNEYSFRDDLDTAMLEMRIGLNKLSFLAQLALEAVEKDIKRKDELEKRVKEAHDTLLELAGGEITPEREGFVKRVLALVEELKSAMQGGK